MNTREEFGKYLLLKKLSDDPLGETFRAGRVGQRGLEQVVLLRVLNGQGLDGEKVWTALSARKEVQSALKSPNIGNGVDAGRVRGVPYIAYDYVSGKDLATLSAQAQREGSPFPTDHALLIGDRIGLALTAAYETRLGGERVHHGMVVPHLVMISNEGETRVLGFEAGPALAAQAPALPPEVLRYLAPEVRTGAAPGKSSDVFSLGAILFELLTGKPLPAAPAGEYTTLLAQARLAGEGTPLPPAVTALLTKSLAAPDERLPDPTSWHKALSRILSEGGYNATTFNLAFFMHNLFREEIEQESKEIEQEKTLDVPAGRGVTLAPAGAETVKLPREEMRKAAAGPAPGAAAQTPDDTSAVKARYGMDEQGEAGSKKGLWIGLAAAVLLAAVGAGVWFGYLGPRRAAAEAEAQEELARAQAPVLEPEPAEPPEPAGPTPEELQAQIDSMFDERAKAMEASFKAEADKRIAELQRQLDQAQEAAEERARRLEEARKEAEAAKAADAAEKKEEPETAVATKAPQADPAAAKTQLASGPGDDPAGGSGVTPAIPAPQPVETAPAPQPPPEPEPAAPQVKRGELVNPGPGVVAPRLVRRASPTFPPAAARLNREATVDVRVLVDETGKVIEAEVEGRRAGMGFDEEALQAARASVFEPATKFDVPVKMWTAMRFVFKK
ncbi:MAG TPA: TonB family protein [Thermoanaerobaculia bacterium]|nr:TonB family protein [Thermoanaerobaculia bacterium]